ncbi:MAG: MATE family efflux transporter [Bacteroidales bacterium]
MYSNKEIFKISYPIFLGLIAQNIVNVTDTAFLGRVGETELGASALAGVCYIALFMIAFGFSQGSQILIGRRNGEKKYNAIGDIFFHGIIFLMILGVLVFAAVQAFGKDAMYAFMSSENIANAATRFLDVRIWGVFFVFPNVMFRAFFVGIQRTKVLSANAIVMAVVNIILDYGLIFGNLGLPEMGLEGAALASVIAEGVSLLFFVIYLIAAVDWKKYGFKWELKYDLKVIRSMLDVSVFTMLQSFVSLSTWFLFFAFVEKLGERPLAISNIVRSFYMILLMPIQALSATSNTMISNAIGAGDTDKVLAILMKIIKMAYLILIPISVIIVLFPKTFLSIYTTDATLIAESVEPLWVLIGGLLFAAAGSIMFNAISGTGNTRSSLFFEVISLIVYTGYMWYVIYVLRSSVTVSWTTELVYWLVLMVTCYPYLLSGKWKDRKI